MFKNGPPLTAVPHGPYVYKIYLGTFYLGHIARNPEGTSVICYGDSGKTARYHFGYSSSQEALNEFMMVVAIG